jgi:hypothetical protein
MQTILVRIRIGSRSGSGYRRTNLYFQNDFDFFMQESFKLRCALKRGLSQFNSRFFVSVARPPNLPRFGHVVVYIAVHLNPFPGHFSIHCPRCSLSHCPFTTEPMLYRGAGLSPQLVLLSYTHFGPPRPHFSHYSFNLNKNSLRQQHKLEFDSLHYSIVGKATHRIPVIQYSTTT